MKIGLLLPGSSTHPLIPHNFMGGLNAALATHQQADQFELFTASIGFGTDEALISNEAEMLFTTQQIDVLIAFADEPKIQKLYTRVNNLKTQLIVVNHGAQFNSGNNGNYVAYHTLDGILSTSLTGSEAKKYSDEAIMVSSFYDGGYALLQTMVDAFLTKKGGLSANFVLRHLLKEFDTTAVKTFLLKHKKPLLCALSGDLVEEFFRQMNDLEGAGAVKMYASPVLMEEASLLKTEINFPMAGYTCWHPSINTDENLNLLSSFGQANGRAADAVAALGWDTALILIHFKNSIQKNNQAFNGVDMTAAKGKLNFDPETNRFLSSQYLANYTPGSQFEYSKSLSQSDILSAWQNITAAHPNGTSAGWVNTYLCS